MSAHAWVIPALPQAQQSNKRKYYQYADASDTDDAGPSFRRARIEESTDTEGEEGGREDMVESDTESSQEVHGSGYGEGTLWGGGGEMEGEQRHQAAQQERIDPKQVCIEV